MACAKVVSPDCLHTDGRGFIEADLGKASEEHLLALSQMNQVLGNVGCSSLWVTASRRVTLGLSESSQTHTVLEAASRTGADITTSWEAC